MPCYWTTSRELARTDAMRWPSLPSHHRLRTQKALLDRLRRLAAPLRTVSAPRFSQRTSIPIHRVESASCLVWAAVLLADDDRAIDRRSIRAVGGPH